LKKEERSARTAGITVVRRPIVKRQGRGETSSRVIKGKIGVKAKVKRRGCGREKRETRKKPKGGGDSFEREEGKGGLRDAKGVDMKKSLKFDSAEKNHRLGEKKKKKNCRDKSHLGGAGRGKDTIRGKRSP